MRPSRIINEAFSEANSASSAEPKLWLPDIHDNIARLIWDNTVLIDSDSDTTPENKTFNKTRIKDVRSKVFSLGSLPSKKIIISELDTKIDHATKDLENLEMI